MLSNERLGRFTAFDVYKLFVEGKGATRQTYIMDKAQEKATGMRTGFIGNKITEHGEFNEYEAIEMLAEHTGLNIEYGNQRFFKYGDNAGATPDAYVKDFDDRILAVVDVKCPVTSFFKQKLLIVEGALPQYQNIPKPYFYQLQLQMMSASATLGYPVKDAYLVRYLTSSHVDDDGNKFEFDLPLGVRLLIKHITADEAVQEDIAKAIDRAANERDELVKIFNTEIPYLTI